MAAEGRLNTGMCTAEGTVVGLAEMCSLITGSFPITSPEDTWAGL